MPVVRGVRGPVVLGVVTPERYEASILHPHPLLVGDGEQHPSGQVAVFGESRPVRGACHGADRVELGPRFRMMKQLGRESLQRLLHITGLEGLGKCLPYGTHQLGHLPVALQRPQEVFLGPHATGHGRQTEGCLAGEEPPRGTRSDDRFAELDRGQVRHPDGPHREENPELSVLEAFLIRVLDGAGIAQCRALDRELRGEDRAEHDGEILADRRSVNSTDHGRVAHEQLDEPSVVVPEILDDALRERGHRLRWHRQHAVHQQLRAIRPSRPGFPWSEQSRYDTLARGEKLNSRVLREGSHVAIALSARMSWSVLSAARVDSAPQFSLRPSRSRPSYPAPSLGSYIAMAESLSPVNQAQAWLTPVAHLGSPVILTASRHAAAMA